jgi:hypothetical protein
VNIGWVNLIELVRDSPPTDEEIEQVLKYRRQKAKARGEVSFTVVEAKRVLPTAADVQPEVSVRAGGRRPLASALQTT